MGLLTKFNDNHWCQIKILSSSKNKSLLTFFLKLRGAPNIIYYCKPCYTLVILIFSVSCFTRRWSVKQSNPSKKYSKTPMDLFLFFLPNFCVSLLLILSSEMELRVNRLCPYCIFFNFFKVRLRQFLSFAFKIYEMNSFQTLH